MTQLNRNMGYAVSLVGASGRVGREILKILHDRQFPLRHLEALASEKSVGKTVPFGDSKVELRPLDGHDFSRCDIVFFAAGAGVASLHAERAAKSAAVIDLSSHFRMKEGVPLIVPEINADSLRGVKYGLIANPNCSTAQLVVALKPLHDAAEIRRVHVATYQSVSGAGRAGMEALRREGAEIETDARSPFTKPIAHNLIPHIDRFLEDGETKEEWKMASEVSKILGAEIPLSALCVRVPVMVGHAEAVWVELGRALSVEAAREALRAAPGCAVMDDHKDGGYATPLEAEGRDPVYISRIRRDKTVKHGLIFWVVADNLRKGAALNAVQIAERLIWSASAL